MSWLIQHDVDEGRATLNWSTWGSGHGESEAAEAVQEGKMPPFVYVIAHPNASFSQADKDAFIRGLIATFGRGGN
jgi:hypothetical protein